MRKEHDRIDHLEKMIVEVRGEISVVKELPYYDIFGTEGEREKDLRLLHKKLLDLNSQMFAALESMELAIQKRKVQLSNQHRKLTQKINETITA